MEHALVMDNESHGMGTGCSRCGATDKAALALPCQAVSDGAIYQGKPLSQEELDCLHFDFEEEADGFSEEEEAALNCGMGPNGQCDQAGSEYCDLQCPYRD